MQENLKTPLPSFVMGTSFFNSTIIATVTQLKSILGEPDFEDNTGSDKSNFDWLRKLDDGTVFTVYDWKEYRKLKLNEPIQFHIGGLNAEQTERVKVVLLNELKGA